jgi:hypothetical protein
MITIAMMRAAGISEAQILRVIEEEQAERREKERIKKRKQRARPQDGGDIWGQAQKPQQDQTPCPGDKRDISLSLVSKKDLPSKERKGVRGKPTLIPLPDDWQPKGPQRDPTEADEFRDKARAKGWVYANWDAAYRNYQNHPEYNHRNKNGAVISSARPEMTAAEGRALVEAKRLQILREAENAEKGNDARLRGNSDMGDGRERNAPQLRLAGGISHEDAERRRAESDALFTATASALRR